MAVYEIKSYIYPIWMILVGIAMYFSGLFSLKYFERYGLLLILAGCLSTFVPEPVTFMVSKRLAEVVMGIGFVGSVRDSQKGIKKKCQ